MNCKSVMVVDDDSDIRASINEMFINDGYNILLARNGFEALEILTKIPHDELPGLIILDLMMPVMDGYSFLREIESKHPDLIHLPIVVASAHAQFANGISLSLAKEKIQKPFDLEILYDLLEKYCGKPSK